MHSGSEQVSTRRQTIDSAHDQPLLFGEEALCPPVEIFTRHREQGRLVRSVLTRDGDRRTSSVPLAPDCAPGDDLAAEFDRSWLRAQEYPRAERDSATVRIVDLFSGCGALTLGVVEACRALELRGVPIFAVDINEKALAVYARNFPTADTTAVGVEALLDSEIGQPLSEAEARLKSQLGRVDMVIGGPPCQGHSDLNNHTRRNDPKNSLYLKMARFAEVVGPTHIIIENVPGVIHDKSGVSQETRQALRRLGYRVDAAVLKADELGVAQSRRRFFTIASRTVKVTLPALSELYSAPGRTIRWAIEDLSGVSGEKPFDTSATHSAENQRRIRYLFENDLVDLPDSERPDCHRLKKHSYKSVYGRLSWDETAPTITTGFGSTGQGRFVHPAHPRTLTPHEAARLQFIPDFFSFGGQNRGALQEMIGNAVPPKLSYVLALELLR